MKDRNIRNVRGIDNRMTADRSDIGKKDKAFYTLEFNKIIDELLELTVTSGGREKAEMLSPTLSEIELKRMLRDTTEARNLLDKIGTPPIPTMDKVDQYVDSSVKGEMLLPYQLEEVGVALAGIRRFKDYLIRGKKLEIGLAYREDMLDSIEGLREDIYRSIRGGRVDDYASNSLRDIRRKIVICEDRIKAKAEELLQSQKDCFSDRFVVHRNGRICLPVKKDYKFKIPGSVIDKSSTGATLFIEPTAISKYTEELQYLRMDEENEERIILYTLSSGVAERVEILLRDIEEINQLDYIFAKGKLSVSMKAIEPKININRHIHIEEGRHPFVEEAICVPLNFTLGIETETPCKGIVITGPNTGGKTVAIKTVGLFSLMAQSGLHIPCKEANMCMNSNVLCDIGDGQNISENLSTFSAHITNILSILKNVNEESLVILDELGSGTDPQEGMGIAIAILEELRESKCLFLATTHYPEVKTYAKEQSEIMSASMAFDTSTLLPLYRLELGKSGNSQALHIARRLGMSDKLLSRAYDAAYVKPKRKENDGETVEDANTVSCDNNRKDSMLLDGEEVIIEKESNSYSHPKIELYKVKPVKTNVEDKYGVGDCVMVYPERKLGIVVLKANGKGEFLIQLKKEKRLINHKRLKLHVKADMMYPEDYDFSIVFDSVTTRKKRHEMDKRLVTDGIELDDKGF